MRKLKPCNLDCVKLLFSRFSPFDNFTINTYSCKTEKTTLVSWQKDAGLR